MKKTSNHRPLPFEREAEWTAKPGKSPESRIYRIMQTNDSRQKTILGKMNIPKEIATPNVATVYVKKKNMWVMMGWRCLDCEKPMRDREVVEKHPLICKRTNIINKDTEGDFMPIHRIVQGGKTYYRWGDHGKMYTDRKDAEKQAAAAHASGYKEPMNKLQDKNK